MCSPPLKVTYNAEESRRLPRTFPSITLPHPSFWTIQAQNSSILRRLAPGIQSSSCRGQPHAVQHRLTKYPDALFMTRRRKRSYWWIGAVTGCGANLATLLAFSWNDLYGSIMGGHDVTSPVLCVMLNQLDWRWALSGPRRRMVVVKVTMRQLGPCLGAWQWYAQTTWQLFTGGCQRPRAEPPTPDTITACATHWLQWWTRGWVYALQKDPLPSEGFIRHVWVAVAQSVNLFKVVVMENSNLFIHWWPKYSMLHYSETLGTCMDIVASTALTAKAYITQTPTGSVWCKLKSKGTDWKWGSFVCISFFNE